MLKAVLGSGQQLQGTAEDVLIFAFLKQLAKKIDLHSAEEPIGKYPQRVFLVEGRKKSQHFLIQTKVNN